MKRYFLLFGSLFFLLLPSESSGQEVFSGVWSLAISSGFQYTPSTSMHGEIGQYETALSRGSTPAQYPFALNRAYSIGFGAEIGYRFSKSPLSLYAAGYGLGFKAGYGFRNSTSGRFTMTILSTAAGIEYTFGQTYQRWNFYGRIGIVPNLIASSNRSGNRSFHDSLRMNTADSRLGMEAEIGQRYHFPRLPFGIEASLNYTNINLFGKSYTAPVYSGGFFGRNGSINDGKNPNDPNDHSRTIDFLSLRIGARMYF